MTHATARSLFSPTSRRSSGFLSLSAFQVGSVHAWLLGLRLLGYLPLRGDIPVPPGIRSASNLVVISVDPSRIVSEIGQRKASLAAWAASIPKPLPAGAQAQTK